MKAAGAVEFPMLETNGDWNRCCPARGRETDEMPLNEFYFRKRSGLKLS